MTEERGLLLIAQDAALLPTSVHMRAVGLSGAGRAEQCTLLAVIVAARAAQAGGTDWSTLTCQCDAYLTAAAPWHRACAALMWLFMTQTQQQLNEHPLANPDVAALLHERFAQVVGEPCSIELDARGLARAQVAARCSREAARVLEHMSDDQLQPLADAVDNLLQRMRQQARAEIALSIALNKELEEWAAAQQANTGIVHGEDDDDDDDDDKENAGIHVMRAD
jgi:hypothetical protein